MTIRRREVKNVFKDLTDVGSLLRRGFAVGCAKYHPENDQVGIQFTAWLRRLGASEIQPLLKAGMSISRLEF